jgi:toxin ParE1/3/4
MSPSPSSRTVLLTRGAEHDLQSIHDYIKRTDSPANATQVIDGLLEALNDLARFADRGSHPRELAELGIREYRQLVHKAWRILYRARNGQVIIMLVVDSRRDLQSVLARRLLSR